MAVTANEILSQVQAGNASADWRVTRANMRYFLIWTIVFSVLLLALLGAVYYMVFLEESYFYYPVLEFIPEELWVPLNWIIYIVIAGIFLWGIVRNGRNVLDSKQQMVIAMPEGFVVKKEGAAKLYEYTSITALETEKDRYQDITFVATFTDGKKEQIEIDGRFGNPEPIIEHLVTTYQSRTSKA